MSYLCLLHNKYFDFAEIALEKPSEAFDTMGGIGKGISFPFIVLRCLGHKLSFFIGSLKSSLEAERTQD